MVVFGYAFELVLGALIIAVFAWAVKPAETEQLVERVLDELYARSPAGRRARVDARRELQRRMGLRLVPLPQDFPDRGGWVGMPDGVARRVFDQDTDELGGDAA